MIRHLSALAAALVVLAAGPVAAQVQRNFPKEALRGALVVVAAPEVLLNDVPTRLAPGARIRGPNNMLVMSGSITGQRLLVNYSVDMQGQLKDVWILTAGEAARQPWPVTPAQAATWEFDAAAQTWTRR